MCPCVLVSDRLILFLLILGVLSTDQGSGVSIDIFYIKQLIVMGQ